MKISWTGVNSYMGEFLDYEDYINDWFTLPKPCFQKFIEQALIQTGINIDPTVIRDASTLT